MRKAREEWQESTEKERDFKKTPRRSTTGGVTDASDVGSGERGQRDSESREFWVGD